MNRRGVLCVSLALVSLAVAGCAVLTRIPRLAGPSGQAPAQAFDDGHNDVAGVIHIHTTASHDAHGRFEDVVRVANAQGLDYVVVTEHNTLRPLREGRQGWHGSVLVLIGMELSTRGGHYLALNVTEDIDRFKLTTQQVIDEVARQGGLGFIAHPYFKKGRWKDWTVTGFTGIEAYNVAHDTLDENRMRLVLWTLTAAAEPFYLSLLDRPYDPLATWDELVGRHGRVVGIGSADAHEFHALGLKFAPYEIMFQLARTHLLVPPGELTEQAVYAALRQGHAYLSIELAAPAKGFQFAATADGKIAGIMGDEVVLEPDLHLTAWLPSPAQLALFRDGQRIAVTTAQAWEVPVTQPGAYRLEATRHTKPWIFSNPIYVRPPPAPPAD
ncbi:MAG: CehA/McbA family metallohydrolase [Candidatus Omnitrophica bacterium]|nr:CehA/McbA family metallohydrolase [Candidatus Omnitrophota bacterium]